MCCIPRYKEQTSGHGWGGEGGGGGGKMEKED